MSNSTYIKSLVSVSIVLLYFYYQNTDTQQPSVTDKIEMQRFLCDFEVFGRVQGVFFRKFTQEQAQSLDLTGWCKNTPEGTVQGQLEGAEDKITAMQSWLRNTGSPQSSITKAVFSELKPIDASLFSTFEVIRKKKK